MVWVLLFWPLSKCFSWWNPVYPFHSLVWCSPGLCPRFHPLCSLHISYFHYCVGPFPVSPQLFNNNQLYVTGPTSELFNLELSTQPCISQLESWMNVNKLKMNKIRLKWFWSAPPKSVLSLPHQLISMPLNHHIFLCSLSQHVAYVCHLCYLEIRRISSVHHLLTDYATKPFCALLFWITVMLCSLDTPEYLIESSEPCCLTCLPLLQILSCQPSPPELALAFCL